jgi:hypothetical protein
MMRPAFYLDFNVAQAAQEHDLGDPCERDDLADDQIAQDLQCEKSQQLSARRSRTHAGDVPQGRPWK